MIAVNRQDDLITGYVNGKPFGIAFSEEKYDAMKALELKAAQAADMDELTSIIEEFQPLLKEDYKELVEHAEGGKYLFVNRHTGKIYLTINGVVSNIPLPQALVDRIITSVEKKIDVLPLVKCWARFIRPVKGRPAYSDQRGKDFAAFINADYVNEKYAEELIDTAGLARDVARKRATTKQVSITQEGLLVGYKVSKEILTRYDLNENEEVIEKSRYRKSVDPDTGMVTYDEPKHVEDRLFEPYIMGNSGDSFLCGDKFGHFIRVGCVHALDSWDKVGNPGCKGLHFGGLRYISGYQQEGTVTHNIFVDPMDIYGVGGLGNGSDGACTTKRYFVHSSFAGVNRSIYHSSEYAKLTDAEYAELFEAAVEQATQKMDKIQEQLNQQKALL